MDERDRTHLLKLLDDMARLPPEWSMPASILAGRLRASQPTATLRGALDAHLTSLHRVAQTLRSECEVCRDAAATPSDAREEELRAALERGVRNATRNDVPGIHDTCTVGDCWVTQARAALAQDKGADR